MRERQTYRPWSTWDAPRSLSERFSDRLVNAATDKQRSDARRLIAAYRSRVATAGQNDVGGYVPAYGLTVTADPSGEPIGWRTRVDRRDFGPAGSAPRRDSTPFIPASDAVAWSNDETVAWSDDADDPTPTVTGGSWVRTPSVAECDLAALRRSVLRRLPIGSHPALVDDAIQGAYVELVGLRSRHSLPVGEGPMMASEDRPDILNGRTAYGFAASRAVRGIGPSHGVQTRSRLPRTWSRETVGVQTETAIPYRTETVDADGQPVAVTEWREGPVRYVGRSTPVAMGPSMGDPVSAAMASATGTLATVLRVARDVAGQPGSRGLETALGRYAATGSATGQDASPAASERYRRAGRAMVATARTEWESALADAETVADAMPEALDALDAL